MGLTHVYCGDGKGKTTAAVGLSVRCAGAGGRVVFAQFHKDGSSSELRILEGVPEIRVLVCRERFGFYKRMSEETREKARAAYTALLEEALLSAASPQEGAVLLVLDEAVSAMNHGMIPEDRVLAFLDGKPEGLEVVLTGREPPEALLERADYVTEMVKRKHPFDRGIAARRGIEF